MCQIRLYNSCLLLFCCIMTGSAWAQSVPKERRITHREQSLTVYEPFKAEELWKRIEIPPSPPLNREQALESFRTAPGFRIECVAAEPLVVDPVQFEFDADGRIWVVEMRGYMRDMEGKGEGDPIGQIVVLEDTNGDTFMDKSTVFLGGLVMARTVQFVQGGVLVQEPPNLWYCQDRDGDLRCDTKRLVGQFGRPGNPQHTDNGLFRAIDNWMYNADSSVRHKFIDGKLIEEKTARRGQWGITQDDYGRLYYCYENRPLHADLVPSEFILRNRHFQQRLDGGRDFYGMNTGIGADSKEIHPIRVAPGITLGGNELREDGTLRTFTIAAGPSIYRGDQFPPKYYGCAVIPESGGNLIRLSELGGDGVNISVRNYFEHEKLEWVASTDERFRPVNSRTGPDGAVYVCDMYKGIIEHVVFLMPYMRRYIEKQDLEDPVGWGRIYRIRWEGKPLGEVPKMSQQGPEQWVRHLSHPNGWWRDTAQRLLVDAKAIDQTEALRRLATSGDSPFGRLHALWTLEGMGQLDWAIVDLVIGDEDAMVRAAAIRLAARFNTMGDVALDRISAAFADERPVVRLQLLMTLGAFRSDRAEALTAKIVLQHRETLYYAAAVSGLESRELEFLQRLLTDPVAQQRSRAPTELYTMLAMAVFNESHPNRVASLLDMVTEQLSRRPLLSDALIEGIHSAHLSRRKWPKPIRLPHRPSLFVGPNNTANLKQKQQLDKLLRVITWPGDTTARAVKPESRPLTPEEAQRFAQGQAAYAASCFACHDRDGQGQEGRAPSLVESEWVNGPPRRLVRIALHGLAGPLDVHGQTWNMVMPGFGSSPGMNNEHMAAVLTYVRRAWGNWGEPIDARLVARVRSASASRQYPWTTAELVDAEDGKVTPRQTEPVVAPLDPLANYRKAVLVGDAERGRVLFHTNLSLRCRACHVVGETGGGFIGPDLTEVGARATREYLLDSLINPSAQIVEGFQTVMLQTDDGWFTGTLVAEDDERILISPPTGGQAFIAKDKIEERFVSSISSMPPVGQLFSAVEIGDLVAYLASLKKSTSTEE